MKLPRLILLALLLGLPGVIAAQAPDFTFERSWNTPAGMSKLSDYRGQVVLVEVWATW